MLVDTASILYVVAVAYLGVIFGLALFVALADWWEGDE